MPVTLELSDAERDLLLDLLERADRSMLHEYGKTESITLHRAIGREEDMLRGVIERLRATMAA